MKFKCKCLMGNEMKTKYDWSKVYDDEIMYLSKNNYSGVIIGHYTVPELDLSDECYISNCYNVQNDLSFKGEWIDSLEHRPERSK